MFRPLRQACQVSLEILAFSHTVHGHEANTSGHVTEESSISVCRKHYQSLELSFQSCQPWRPWIDVGIGWLLLMALAALAPLFDDIFHVLICEWCRICYEFHATPESQRTTPGVPSSNSLGLTCEITWDHLTVVLSSPVVSLVFFLHNLGIEFWFSGSFFWSLKNCGKPKRYLEWFILGLWCMGCGHSSCSNFEAKRLADFWARCCRWSGLSAVEVGGACGYKVATREMASLVGSWLW